MLSYDTAIAQILNESMREIIMLYIIRIMIMKFYVYLLKYTACLVVTAKRVC